jgi:hypothetical protein
MRREQRPYYDRRDELVAETEADRRAQDQREAVVMTPNSIDLF